MTLTQSGHNNKLWRDVKEQLIIHDQTVARRTTEVKRAPIPAFYGSGRSSQPRRRKPPVVRTKAQRTWEKKHQEMCRHEFTPEGCPATRDASWWRPYSHQGITMEFDKEAHDKRREEERAKGYTRKRGPRRQRRGNGKAKPNDTGTNRKQANRDKPKKGKDTCKPKDKTSKKDSDD